MKKYLPISWFKQDVKRIIIIGDLICLLLLGLFWFSLPQTIFKTPTSYVIEASNGSLLGAAAASDGQWRFPMADSIPDKFEKCIIAFEDKRFYKHFGVDPMAFARAIKQNIGARKVVSGGSTLSMQVIRLSRRQDRTIWQKVVEMLLAIRLEISHSKKDIIRLYSANAPFGSNVVGLDAASWRYFGRNATQLSWGEMATLAVLPNSPSLVHPGKNRDKLIKKRNDLLDKLVTLKYIDQGTASLAKLEPIPGKPLALPELAPHLLSRFRSEYRSLKLPLTKARTTINAELQSRVNDMLKRYNNRYRSNGINNIAALVLDIETGNTLVYCGNIYQPQYPELESHVDMVRASRSPGSTLKPILFASMLNDGKLLPQSLVPDIPTQIGGYSPQNFDLGYDGAIPASKALSRSLNIPAVRMLQQYKYGRLYEQLKKLNFSTLTRNADFYGLSLILGGCEVNMWELAGAYASMARTLNHFNLYKGKYNPYDLRNPQYITRKISEEEQHIQYHTQNSSVVDHGSLWATFNAMEEVMRPGEEGLWEQFSSSQRVAWKTGTSFGFRDGWAIGLDPRYVVCVWVGNADGEGRPGLTGIETAAPVMFDIFKLLPRGKWFETPLSKLKRISICKQSGFRASDICPDKVDSYVPVAGLRSPVCPYHQLVHLDPTEQFRVTSNCESPSNMIHKAWFVLPPTMEYYYRAKDQGYLTLPPFKPGCSDAANEGRVMELIYPKNNSVIYIPIELNGERGKTIFNAAHRDHAIKIYWHIDDVYIGTTQHFHQLAVSPPAGKHTLTLVDEHGERITLNFVVLDKEKEH